MVMTVALPGIFGEMLVDSLILSGDRRLNLISQVVLASILSKIFVYLYRQIPRGCNNEKKIFADFQEKIDR